MNREEELEREVERLRATIEDQDNCKLELLFKKVDEITVNSAKYRNKLTETLTKMNSDIEAASNKIDIVTTALNGAPGSADKGLNIRIDRLEQDEEKRKWYMRTALTASIGALIATIYERIRNGGNH